MKHYLMIIKEDNQIFNPSIHKKIIIEDDEDTCIMKAGVIILKSKLIF